MAKIIEDANLRNKNHFFRDRFHAGELLAKKLRPHLASAPSPIVLAVPSGGVPVGSMIAKELGIPMDLVIVRKLPIPYNTEAGFGSVGWDGEVVLNKRLVRELRLSDSEIKSVVQSVRLELERRMEKFRGGKPFPELKGRTVILVDDGLASGYTMLSAVGSVKRHSPAVTVVAVPTGSLGAVRLVSPHVDELFCLNVRDTAFLAVADAYQEWHDLTEEEVVEIIRGM